jgi:hypothetical protein
MDKSTEDAFAQAAKEADAKKAESKQEQKQKQRTDNVRPSSPREVDTRVRDTSAQPTEVEGGTRPDAGTMGEFQRQKSAKHFRIVIPSTGLPGEVKRVFIGVNGVPYTILRDVEVVVPQCVLDALDVAVEKRYRDGPKDELGNITKVPYDVKSYHYQNLGEADPTKKAAKK